MALLFVVTRPRPPADPGVGPPAEGGEDPGASTSEEVPADPEATADPKTPQGDRRKSRKQAHLIHYLIHDLNPWNH